MNLYDVLMSVIRRWYIVLVGVLAAAGVGVAVFLHVPPTYEQASSSLLLPGSTTVEEGSNPLLFVGGLVQQRDLLIRAMQADDVRDPILEAHPHAGFTVGPDFTTSGPVVAVHAEGETKAATTAIMLAANEAVAAELEDLQARVGAPPSTWTTMLELVTDKGPTVIRKTQLRSTAGAVAAVLAFSVLVAALVDGRVLARRRQPKGAGPEPDPAPATAAHLAEEVATADPLRRPDDVARLPGPRLVASTPPLTGRRKAVGYEPRPATGPADGTVAPHAQRTRSV